MSSAWYWQELGIAPTSDSAIIRRAYAAKLKVTRPEDDRDGFDRLRQAYETALQLARGETPRAASATSIVLERDRPVPHDDALAGAAAPAPPPDAATQKLVAALQRLQQLLHSARADSQEAHETLAEVLRSPALENLSNEKQTERRLAEMLASALPGSGPLLRFPCERFGWIQADAELARSPSVAAILQFIRDREFLEEMRSGRSPYSDAFGKLQRKKIPLISWAAAHVGKAGTPGEYELLQVLRMHHPSLLEYVEPTTIEWWDKIASRPPALFAIIALGALLTAIAAFRGIALEDYRQASWNALTVAAAFAALVAWKLFLLDWPRRWILKRWAVLPSWVAVGWLPASVVLVLLSAFAPDSRIVMWAFGVPAVLLAHWAWIMAGLNRGGSSMMSIPLIRALLFNLLMFFFWLGCVERMPPSDALHVVVLAALIGSAIGLPAACWAWEARLDARQRASWTLGCAVLALTALAVLWWLAPTDGSRPLCAALVVAAVVSLRHAMMMLSKLQQQMRIGWMVASTAAVITALVLEPLPDPQSRNVMLEGFGAVLTTTVLVCASMVAWNEHKDRVAAYRDDPLHESMYW